ncbi:MAG: SprB repeat-containing protein [Bacteroidetes bacterium]|nr:SprB repeat-containing protein [Bacteroidota bacterium]
MAAPSTSGDPYTYLWSDGQTTATAVGLAAGTYVVTVTDSLGCNATAVIITQPGNLSISGAGTDVLCNGGATGIIMVQATSGTAPYTFAITPAGTQSNPTADSAVFTGLAAGTYTVTVTDAGGCTAEIDVMVMEPGALAMNMSSIGLTCNGNASGTATANVIGGVQGVTMQAQGMLTVSTDNPGFLQMKPATINRRK